MKKYKKKNKNKFLLTALFLSAVITILSFMQKNNDKNIQKGFDIPPSTSTTDLTTPNMPKATPEVIKDIPQVTETTPEVTEPVKKQITLSFAGDCTIGTDPTFGYDKSFINVFDDNNGDFGYFFDGVKEIFNKDDITVVNLETTFTKATKEAEKTFNFKGDPSYVNILNEGSVEVVNLANNHTYDFLDKGYNDTLENLDKANVDYYGNSIYAIKEANGLKIGFAGFTGWNTTNEKITDAMTYFNEQKVDLKIVSFHWGIERDNYFNADQQGLAKSAIDNGADLVIGHHPHVLQGIEKYNGKYIVYSLGNFVFGGNRNPDDKDSMIFQQTFYFEDNKLVNNKINIIPVSISSKSYVNDYQPTILEGEAKQKVLTRINKYSHNFSYED